MVTLDDLDAFKKEMDAAGADYEVLLLPGAKHGFSNPGADENARRFAIDVGYQQAADDRSWAAMLRLFDETLQRG